MQNASYIARRGQVATYFDRTAADAWARLTSDVPVSGIRATVRAGRDRMRAVLLAWLPGDLRGRRILDAGCGTGALSSALAERGAEVVAVDLSPKLIGIARERHAIPHRAAGAIDFRAGDMLDAALGRFDHVVCMDSLIHYQTADAVRAIAGLAERTSQSLAFTFAPRTSLLAAMHLVGRLFPRGNRAPAIEPVAQTVLAAGLAGASALDGWATGRTQRIDSGFYMSQAMELVAR